MKLNPQNEVPVSSSSSDDANAITRFRGEFKFLSNFEASTFFWKGKKYATLEHAYQAAKSIYPDEAEAIRNAIAPSQAKKMGKMVRTYDGWDDDKAGIMLELLRLKFQNVFLRWKLLQTGNAVLIEGNTWHDTYWGVCKCDKCGNSGLNTLGKLLMQVREEVKAENENDATMAKQAAAPDSDAGGL